MKSATRSRTAANGASAWSESTASLARTLFSPARIASTLSSSRSAGLARRMTAFRSLPRPARPAPSSLMMIVRRWRSGRRVMSPQQVDVHRAVTCSPPAADTRPAPSWPLRDLLQRRRQRRAFGARLGRQAVDELLADQRLRVGSCSWRRRGSPGSRGFRCSARPRPSRAAWAVTDPTVPTLTPSIFTFSPGIMLPASSKIARTV